MDDDIEAITISSPIAEEVPMETELEEIVEVNSSGECVSTSFPKETVPTTSNHASHLAVVSVASKPSPGPSATAMKTVLQSGIHKLGTQLSGQVLLNKASDITSGNRFVKQEKLIVTTIGKSSHPIVLIPQNQMSGTQKVTPLQHVDGKGAPQQIKLVTIGSRSDMKPVLGMSSLTSAQLITSTSKSSVLQTQQVQNVQVKYIYKSFKVFLSRLLRNRESHMLSIFYCCPQEYKNSGEKYIFFFFFRIV